MRRDFSEHNARCGFRIAKPTAAPGKRDLAVDVVLVGKSVVGIAMEERVCKASVDREEQFVGGEEPRPVVGRRRPRVRKAVEGCARRRLALVVLPLRLGAQFRRVRHEQCSVPAPGDVTERA